MAINRRLSQPLTRNREEVWYTGLWAIGATGAVGTKTGGMGMTLTRTGTGLYTLTLEDAPAAILHIIPRTASDTHVVNHLTFTSTGGTFRTAVYASPQTGADITSGEYLAFTVIALKSLVK